MKKIIFSLFLLSLVLFLAPVAVQADTAAEIKKQLDVAGGSSGFPEPVDPRITAVLIIRVILGLIGVILIALNVYSGVLWITAGGNEEQVTKAKTIIRNSTIGLVIVLSAYSLTILVAHLAQGYVSNDYGWQGGLLGKGGFW